ncbi:MAG: PAS domain S-box protein [Thermoleophilia bacterium]
MSRGEGKNNGDTGPLMDGVISNGELPPLEQVLGQETILKTVEPFTDYLETAVAVYDRDGKQIGEVQTGNEFCRFLVEAAGSKCVQAGRVATLAAIESGRQEETNCCGGLLLCASPIIIDGSILGAIVGAVSEVPSDEDSIGEISRCCGVESEQLLQKAGKVFHKPDYLYSAARKHLELLAQLLGNLYEAALEKDTALARTIEQEVKMSVARELDQRIFSSMAAGLAVLEADLTVQVWNDAAERITGISESEATGRNAPEVLPPSMIKGFEEIARDVMRTGVTWQNSPGNGGSIYSDPPFLDITIRPLCGKGDSASGVVVLFEDVTEEVKLNQELDRHVREIEAINKVITASSASLIPEAFLTQTSKAIQEAIDARLVAIYTHDDKNSVLRLGGSSFEPDPAIRVSVETLGLDGSVVDQVMKSGKVVVIFDLATDERVTPHLREIALNQGFTSFVAMPVTSRDDILAILLVFSDSQDICTENQIRFIDLLSYQLGIALQNGRLFSEVEGAGEFMENMLNSMDEAAYSCDVDRNLTFVNPAAEKLTGYKVDELLGMNIYKLIADDQKDILQDMIVRRKSGLVDRYELDLIKKDGTRITISQAVSPLIHDGAMTGIVGVASDVTQEKLIHRQIERQNQRLGLLQSIIQESVSSLGRGKALKTLVREVAEAFDYDICNIFMPDASGSRLQIVASHGFAPDFIQQLNNGENFNLEYHRSLKTPLALAYCDGKQTAVKNVITDSPDDGIVAAANERGFHSIVATPLDYHGKRLGIMVVYTREIREFDEEELGLLASIAAQASTIAGSDEIFNKLARSEERYREIYNMAADWMYMLDENGEIIDCNDTMAQSLGLAREAVIGSYIYEHEIGGDREKAVEVIERFKKQGKVGMIFSSERTFLSIGGRKLIVEVHARALQAPSGDGFQWSVIGRDITEKKEAEQRINLLAAAVDNTHECVIISDLNGDIISINNAGAALLGNDAEAMAGMHMGEFWSDRNPEGLRDQIYIKTLESGWEGQMWYRRADGSDIPVFVSSARVDDAFGKPMALVGIARDISAEQRLTSEILRRNRELAVLNSVATATSSSLNLEQALENSLDAIIDSMNYSGGIIFLMNKGSELLSPAASTYAIPEEMMAHLKTIKIGQGHTGKIAESGAPIFIDDYKGSEYYMPELPDIFPIASIGGVPLIFKDRVLGVLIVSSATPHEFGENEQALLAAVGNSIGVAIENAYLFEDVARGKTEWETTFDAMTNGVSIHDLDNIIVRANSALAKLLGTTIDKIVGRKCHEVFHNSAEPLAVCPQVLAFKDGCSHTIVVEEPKLKAVLNVSSDPIFDKDGNIVGAVHDVRDITEQERLREQLSQSEKIRALGEMAGGVAHDFNNFLTVILGNTQLMLSQINGGDGDQEFRESLESVQRAAADAAETVRRIQEFTRVRTARSFTIVDVKRVILNSIDIARPRWHDEAKARGAKIEIVASIDRTPPVNANESELTEVFTNLIINAADALPGDGRITVTTDTEPGGEWVLVIVSDTGEGMDEEVKKRVFEPFFSTKGVGGSGLGLSVAYGIVNRHGGDIMVESKPGDGTRFVVRLPVATMAELNGAGEHLESAEPAAAAEVESGLVRTGKLLVVDDEPMVRKLLGDMIHSMAHNFEVAEDGEQALAIFDAAVDAGEPFDLVLTDLGMPGMSGWDVVDAIKQRSPETPVVLITGWGDQLDAQKMRESGVESVIAKPFRVEDIVRTLAKAIS